LGNGHDKTSAEEQIHSWTSALPNRRNRLYGAKQYNTSLEVGTYLRGLTTFSALKMSMPQQCLLIVWGIPHMPISFDIKQ